MQRIFCVGSRRMSVAKAVQGRRNVYTLGLSSLMTITAPRMREVIEALKRNNLRDKLRVIVGGAPITQDFADSIGADGYAPDAVTALEKARQLVDKW